MNWKTLILGLLASQGEEYLRKKLEKPLRLRDEHQAELRRKGFSASQIAFLNAWIPAKFAEEVAEEVTALAKGK